jgi:hypothetical protein
MYVCPRITLPARGDELFNECIVLAAPYALASLAKVEIVPNQPFVLRKCQHIDYI